MEGGRSHDPAASYLYTTSVITVPTLKRHVIPSNEILVTPWLPHSLSFVRILPSSSLSLSLCFSTHLSPSRVLHPSSSPSHAHTYTLSLSLHLSFSSVHPPMPYNITIANSTVAVALTAVKFGRRKSEGDSPRADTNARDYARLSLREHRPPAPCPLFRFSILVDRDLMPILIFRNGRDTEEIVRGNRSISSRKKRREVGGCF